MKLRLPYAHHSDAASHPARGAWIEIKNRTTCLEFSLVSHPARGAWIEMAIRAFRRKSPRVAPRKGCVD